MGTLVKWYNCIDADTASTSCLLSDSPTSAFAPDLELVWTDDSAENLMQLKARGYFVLGCPPELSALLTFSRN